MPASTRDHLLAMAKGRTYFGHQSVGANIVQGLVELSRRERAELMVSPRSGQDVFALPGLVEETLGENEKPLTKIQAFERAMDGGIGGRADLAFFKFCYVDIPSSRGVEALFERYQDTMSRIGARYPNTKLAHVTVPLTATQVGVKGAVKALLGRPRWGEAENAARHAYNERLRRKCAGKEPLFDLASFEATREDGSSESFLFEGRAIPRLVGAYTDDGQHLNAVGRVQVAAKLAAFVAETLSG
jgi:hypothetical protein